MEKKSQDRSIWNKYITEPLNETFSDRAKKFVSPKYEDTLNELIQTDDSIREEAVELKSLIKSARSNFSRREYILCVVDLGKFHEHLDNIINTLKEFRNHLTGEHEEFLFEGLEPDQLEYLSENLHNRFTKNPKLNRLAEKTENFTIIAQDRSKGLKLLEKGFGKDLKDFKKATESLLNKSEGIFTKFISAFRNLDRGRSKRDLSLYDVTASRLLKDYEVYNILFKSYYVKHILPFINNQKQRKALEEAKMNEQIDAVRKLQAPQPSQSPAAPSSLTSKLTENLSKLQKDYEGSVPVAIRPSTSRPKFNEDDYADVSEEELIFDEPKEQPKPAKIEPKEPVATPKPAAASAAKQEKPVELTKEELAKFKEPGPKPGASPPAKVPSSIKKDLATELKGGIGKK